jgi:hypothetical protein
VADRLRPVLLTTLTTVLGLAPLLFERSSQAEFLKPTVVTLVFGLGFGMILVLLVVPAVTVIQSDVVMRWRALRRMLGRRGAAGQLRLALRLAAVAVAGLVLAVTGPLVMQGAAPSWLFPMLPMLALLPAGLAAVVVVALGTAAVLAGLALLTLRPGRGARR